MDDAPLTEAQWTQLKPGDRLRCIDDDTEGLVLGTQYTVDRTNVHEVVTLEHFPRVWVEGKCRAYYLHRFALVDDHQRALLDAFTK